jgi:transposase-like protein
MSKNQSRKSYSREFKLEAVKMSQQPGVTVAEVARELGLRENDLHTWRQSVKEKGNNVFPGRGRKAQDELAQLKRENARLREENAILKKAAIFFAKETDNSSNS